MENETRGRKKIALPENWDELMKDYTRDYISIENILQKTGFSRRTFFRKKKEWENSRARELASKFRK